MKALGLAIVSLRALTACGPDLVVKGLTLRWDAANKKAEAAGASVTLSADFAPLAHPDNSNLAHVYKMLVVVDPKSMVREVREDNSSKEAPIAP